MDSDPKSKGFSLVELITTLGVISMTLYVVFGIPVLVSGFVTDMDGRMEHSELKLAIQSAVMDQQQCGKLFQNVVIDPTSLSSQSLDLTLPGFGPLTAGGRYGLLIIEKLETTDVQMVSETDSTQTIAASFSLQATSAKHLVRPLNSMSFYKALVLDKTTGRVQDCLRDGLVAELITGDCEGGWCGGPEPSQTGPLKVLQSTSYCVSSNGRYEYFSRFGLYGEGLPPPFMGAQRRIRVYHERDPSLVACDSGWDWAGLPACGALNAKITASDMDYLHGEAGHDDPVTGGYVVDCNMKERSGSSFSVGILMRDSSIFPAGILESGTSASVQPDNCNMVAEVGPFESPIFAASRDKCIAHCLRELLFSTGQVVWSANNQCIYEGQAMTGLVFGGL